MKTSRLNSHFLIAKAFLFLTLLIFNFDVSAQYSINKNPQDERLISSTMDLIYNFEFAEAQRQLNEVRTRFPNHPIYHFLYSMYYYWEMVPISIDNPKYKTYEYHLHKTLALSEAMLKKNEKNPEATFYMMAANTSLIVVYLKAKEYAKSIGEARKTYVFMKEGFGFANQYSDFNLSSGLYYFYADQYPETHPALRPFMWFFVDGDKMKGIEFLKKSAEKSVFSKVESTFFLAHIYLKYLNQPLDALKYAQKLVDKYPQNYFYLSRYVEALVIAKKYNEAKPWAEKLYRHSTDYFQMAGALFLGMIEFNQNHNNAEAKKYLEKAQKIGENTAKQTTDYLSFVYMTLGFISEKENDLNKAKMYFSKLEETGEYKLHELELKAFEDRH